MHLIINLWWHLVRFGFRLLYNELAFSYDIVSKIVSLGAWRCWQRSALKYLPPGAFVLEVAHGTGDLLIDLNAAGYQAVGLDLSPYMGRIAKRKLSSLHVDPHLIRGRAQALSFRQRCFDAVVVTFPTQFIFEKETLREIYRVLTLNGVLVIVPNTTFLGSGIVQQFLEWLYRITGQRVDKEKATIMEDIHRLFVENGFHLVVLHQECPRSSVQVYVANKIPWNP